MANRIFIGRHSSPQTGERMLLRITPPGTDAANITTQAIYSSDNDFLRVHKRSTGQGEAVTRLPGGGGGSYYYYAHYTTFPELPYIPLVYWGITIGDSGGVSNRIFFPFDDHETSEYPSTADVMVSRNALWLYIRGLYVPQTFRFRYIVFENEA